MNRELQCQYHDNFPIIFVNLMKDSDRILKCAKCLSSLKQEVNCLYIQDIQKCNEQSYYENWPPLSDECLRQKILKLKDENMNAEQQIIDYFDELSSDIVKILAEKKKKSLIELQQIKDYKSEIIQEYCKFSQLIQMKDCINLQEKSTEEIEKEIKFQIDQQYEKVDEHTSILSYMIKKYEFVNQFNQNDLSQIKDTLKEIFQFVNFTPYYVLDQEKERVSNENIKNKETELQELKLTHLKMSKQIQYLIKQFDLLKEGIVKNMNKNLYLDNIIEQQLALLLTFQMESVDALQNANLNVFQLYQKIMFHKDQVIQRKKLEECNFCIKLSLQGYMLIPINHEKDNQESINLGIDEQGHFWSQFKQNEGYSHMCYLNYNLDRNKYYTFRIKIEKSLDRTSFKFGLYSPDFKNKKQDANDRMLFHAYEFLDIISAQKTVQQNSNELFFEIRLQIQKNFLQISDFPNYNFKREIQRICSLLQNRYRFYFCLGFNSFSAIGEKIQIIDIQEQDYNDWGSKIQNY